MCLTLSEGGRLKILISSLLPSSTGGGVGSRAAAAPSSACGVDARAFCGVAGRCRVMERDLEMEDEMEDDSELERPSRARTGAGSATLSAPVDVRLLSGCGVMGRKALRSPVEIGVGCLCERCTQVAR